MNAEETKSFIKNFFDSLYEKRKSKAEVLVQIPIIEGNKPMWAEGAVPDKDKWVTWQCHQLKNVKINTFDSVEI